MEIWQLAVYGITGFFAAVFSGIAGAGGGFIMTPLLIFLGLTPAQAVASGKFNGLAVTIGSLSGLKDYTGRVSRLKIAAVMVLALGVGLLAPFIIRSFESQAYRLALGVLLLLLIPLMYVKRIGIKPNRPTPVKTAVGSILLTISLFLQGIFSGGLGSLVNIVLMGMLGMSATEANITKRWSQLVLNTTIIFGVLGSHLIVWPAVAVAVCTGLAGGYVGGKLAIRKGDDYVLNVMLVLMLAAGLLLIIGAF